MERKVRNTFQGPKTVLKAQRWGSAYSILLYKMSDTAPTSGKHLRVFCEILNNLMRKKSPGEPAPLAPHWPGKHADDVAYISIALPSMRSMFCKPRVLGELMQVLKRGSNALFQHFPIFLYFEYWLYINTNILCTCPNMLQYVDKFGRP